jgi:hypothetical protein
MEPLRNDPATPVTATIPEVLTYETPIKASLLAHPLVRRLHRIGDWMLMTGFAFLFLFVAFGRYFYPLIPYQVLQILSVCGVAAVVVGGLCLASHFIIKCMDKFHK